MIQSCGGGLSYRADSQIFDAQVLDDRELPSTLTSDICAGCKTPGLNLLVCDDAEDCSSTKSRFCAQCMIGKKVRVFWPVDEQWYVGIVQQFDRSTGEHLLCYPDGDTEWVKIGENDPTPGDEKGHAKISPDHHVTRPRSENLSVSGGSQSIDSPGGSIGLPQQGKIPMLPSHQPQMVPMHIFHEKPHLGPVMQPNELETSTEKHSGQEHDVSPNDDPPITKSGGDMGASSYARMSYHPSYINYGRMYHSPGMPGHHISYGSSYTQGGRLCGPAPPGPYGYPLPPMHHMVGGGSSTEPGNKRNGRGIEHEIPGRTGQLSSSVTKRKSGPKTWTKEEDAMLLNMVQNMRMPMKWSIVAQSMTDRTGKQCRERYVNHLNPRLKSSDWSPSEDATIFHLYNTSGSQWAKMSKMIPGRTDNGIKNRFHNLRRQLEREDEHRVRLSKPQDFPDEIRLERLRTFPRQLRGKSDELWEMSDGIGVLAAQSVLGGSFSRNAGRFGPFKTADQDGEQCARCGLFAPSVQCGYEVCTRSKWCQTCTRIPPHISSNLLRECINLRRCQDIDKLSIVESWDEDLQNLVKGMVH